MVRNIPFVVPRDGNFSPRDQWSSNDRYTNASSPLNAHHFSGVLVARPSVPVQAIETALREQCGIQIKDFALIATLEDGSTHTFTSEKLMRYERYLFNEEFKETFFRQTNGHYGSFQAYNTFDSDHNLSPRRQSNSTDSSSGMPIRRQNTRLRQDLIKEDSDGEDSTATLGRGRKRVRGSHDDGDDRRQIMAHTSRFRSLRIGDTEEVTKYLEGRFRDLQQHACKIIAKAFVKVVEPKKQTNHPYTGGDNRAPKWWPPLPSPNRTGGVRHKEPDHLLKPERIPLLIHILRISHNPELEKEHVTVKELQLKTKEAMVTFFSEKPENKARQKFLDEIFKVARVEERYRKGEVDGSTVVPVMHGTDQPLPEASEDDDDDAIDTEDDSFRQTMTPQSQISCTPESNNNNNNSSSSSSSNNNMVSPTSTHSQSSIHRPMSSTTVSGPFNNYREMPIRNFHSTPTNPGGLLPRPDDQSSPYEADSLGNMGVPTFLPSRVSDLQQPSQNQHGLPDLSRRPTWNSSNSFPANPNLYHTDWPHNNMMRANPVQLYNPGYPGSPPTPLSSNGPQLPLPNPSALPSLLPPMQQQQQSGGAAGYHDPTMHFRSDQSGAAESHHGMVTAGNNSLRSSSLSNPHHQYPPQQQQQQTTFMHEYLHDYTGHGDEKSENLGACG